MMSKHYEERSYVRTVGADYDYKPRRRSSSRSRHYDDYRPRYSRSNSGSSLSSVSDYEYRGHYVTSERPLVRVPRDVIRAPTPPPVIQRVVERAPTPEPDILERIIVRPQPQQLIERIIERPATPPPRIIDKEVSEPAPPPIVRTRVVKVDSSRYARQPYLTQPVAPIVAPRAPQVGVRYDPGYGRAAPALSSYGYADTQYLDYYNYASNLDRSYSTTTLSTNELMPQYVPQVAPQPAAAAATTLTYNTQPILTGYPATGYPSYGYPAYGYAYGYRPVYNPVPNIGYPRPQI